MKYALIVLVIIGVIALWLMGLFNKLVRLRNSNMNAFAGVDVQLKKRYDLIPNLVATVRQYMEHEKGLLTEITSLRSRAMQPGLTPKEKMDIDNEMSARLTQLNVQVENYPNLKANESFMQLQNSLSKIEEEIAMSRNFYNSSVTNYNTQIQVFPNVLLAGLLGFTPESVLETPAHERGNVDVGATFQHNPPSVGEAMTKSQPDDLMPPAFNRKDQPNLDDVEVMVSQEIAEAVPPVDDLKEMPKTEIEEFAEITGEEFSVEDEIPPTENPLK